MQPTYTPFGQENSPSSNEPPPNDHLEEINKVIEPKRLLTVWSRVLLLILMILALITITSICWKNFSRLDSHLTREIKREEVVSFKRDWFIAKNQEIEGLKHQLKTAKAALASIEEQRKSTWISRESDREIYNRTLERLMALETSLMTAIKEYNSTLSIANSSDIAGLSSATAD